MSASQAWRGVMVVSVVTGSFGRSGNTIPVRIRNWPAVTISRSSTRCASACRPSRKVKSSTAATVVAIATQGGAAKAMAPEKISEEIERRHHQLDIGLALGVALDDAACVIDDEHGAERPGGRQ